MKKMTGNTLVTVAAVVGIIAVVIGIPAISYISANNSAVKYEAEIEAAWTNDKNILAQYQQKVLEATQVPEMYKNDFKEVIAADVQGRYGPNGSQATMQWLKERNLSFDSSVYRQMQQIVEAGRNEFKTGQQRLIDVKQMYEVARGSVWTGLWMRVAGFPKKDLSQFNIVTTTRTEETFKSGVEAAPIKLR